MNLGEPVLDYCERLGPGLLDEPLNALSNGAFLYGAWRLWRAAEAGQAPALTAARRCLAALLALVGAGSLAFHTLATRGTGILDVACIGIFNIAYLILFVRLVARRSWRLALGAGAGFVAFDRLAAALLPAGVANGSLMYGPALLVLALLVAYCLHVQGRAGRRMGVAALVFCLSLLLRSVDRGFCHAWPWGTHFAWHLLNGWVLYRLSGALLLAASAASSKAGSPQAPAT